MEFKYSEYQNDIFDFVKYGYGNGVITAVAGSGKTTTIIKIIDYIKPDKKILFLAFNNSIVDKLKNEIKNPNVSIKTTHSFGLYILRRNFQNIEINENKYIKKVCQYFNDNDLSYNDDIFFKNILKLIDMGRIFLCKTKNDFISIASRYGVIIVDNEIDIVIDILNKNIETNPNEIDFIDMIYLPNVLNVKIPKYDFIIIDEAQDLSISQMNLFLKCFKRGGRFIAVGDENQCINGFAGSDIDSFEKLKNIKNTVHLPLSISYRCAKKIVNHAKKIVPAIESSEYAKDGEVRFKCDFNELNSGDMVVCRYTTPLIKLYMKLYENNITSYIKGDEIKKDLLYILDTIKITDISQLENEIENITNVFNNINPDDFENTYYGDFSDKTSILILLSKHSKDINELKYKINEIFTEKENSVLLLTIHKSKGLESERVYILNNNLTPSKYAKSKWEFDQEKNLEYVSYTRAKSFLGFLYI